MKHIINYVKNRIERNKNFICVITGPTGSGKSYSALSLGNAIAQELHTPFNTVGNVSFEAIEMVKKTELPQNGAPGTVFILEEVGAVGSGGSAFEWQAKVNRYFGTFMQTNRHKNQVLIYTCPDLSNLMASARKLIHMQIETKSINPASKQCRVKPYLCQVNQRTGKIYYKMIRVRVEKGKTKIPFQDIPMPPLEMVAEYEKMKENFTAQKRKDFIGLSEPKKLPLMIQTKEMLVLRTDILRKEGLTQAEIGKKLGLHSRTIRGYCALLKKRTKMAEIRHKHVNFLGDLGRVSKTAAI